MATLTTGICAEITG